MIGFFRPHKVGVLAWIRGAEICSAIRDLHFSTIRDLPLGIAISIARITMSRILMTILGEAWKSSFHARSSGPCSCAKHSTLIVPLFTQEYKWVPANCWGNLIKMLGGNLRWTSIPSRGSSNTPSRLHATETGVLRPLGLVRCSFHPKFKLDFKHLTRSSAGRRIRREWNSQSALWARYKTSFSPPKSINGYGKIVGATQTKQFVDKFYLILALFLRAIL